jgi:hypothetical protein
VTTRHEAGWSTNSTRTSFDDAERRAPPRSLPLRELGVPAPPTGGGASVAIEVEVDDDNDDDDDDELVVEDGVDGGGATTTAEVAQRTVTSGAGERLAGRRR